MEVSNGLTRIFRPEMGLVYCLDLYVLGAGSFGATVTRKRPVTQASKRSSQQLQAIREACGVTGLHFLTPLVPEQPDPKARIINERRFQAWYADFIARKGVGK